MQLGYVAGYADSGSGFFHAGLRLDFPLDFTDNISLTPYIATSIPIDALKQSGIEDTEVFGGVVLRVRF